MNYKIEGETNKCTLTFMGELVVREAQRVKDALVKAVEGYDQVVINTGEITEIDLSFMQLLYSANCLALILKKNLSIEKRFFDKFEDIFKGAGFSHLLGSIAVYRKNEYPQES